MPRLTGNVDGKLRIAAYAHMVYVNVCIYMYRCHFCGPKDCHTSYSLSPDCDKNPDVQTIIFVKFLDASL